MRFSLYTTALMAATVIAKPAPTSNTATCKLVYGSYYGEYDLSIGRPYIDGAGCGNIWKFLINECLGPLRGRKCENDGTGNTHLNFRNTAKTTEVNKALQKAYPMIPFVQNTICPSYLPAGLPP